MKTMPTQLRPSLSRTGAFVPNMSFIAGILSAMLGMGIVSTWSVVSAKETTAKGPTEAEQQRAREHFARGKLAFGAKDFEGAIREYEAAYKIMPLPGLLFNVAQCYRNLNRTDEAIKLFKAYLTNAPGAPNHAAVERLVEELEQQSTTRANQGSSNTSASDASAQSQPHSPSGEAKAAASNETNSADKVDLDKLPEPEVKPLKHTAPIEKHIEVTPARPFYQKWWFWTTVGVVLVGSAVGTWFLATTIKKEPEVLPSRFATWELPDIN